MRKFILCLQLFVYQYGNDAYVYDYSPRSVTRCAPQQTFYHDVWIANPQPCWQQSNWQQPTWQRSSWQSGWNW
jgi:hypothetical protein